MNELSDGFDPIETARAIEESYRGYIASTIHFSDKEYQSQLEAILARPGYLAKGPFLEGAPPYKADKSVRELVDEGVFCRSMLTLGGGDPQHFDPDRKLYAHQVRAACKARKGRNYIVTTGTGSGKTECFLYPIIDDILREIEQFGPQPGVRAMILYPMNALANDQLKRLRELLAGTDITFGRYTGDTWQEHAEALRRWNEENPDSEHLPNELISRDEMRATPPNILLTNYSMLEYLLLRPDDASFFSGAFAAGWRHVAIDEAHVYSGSLGTEIAFLLRRLKARVSQGTGHRCKLRCYATSATMGSKDDLPKIAQFASDLFGEPFETEGEDIDVITGDVDSPVDHLRKPWGTLPLEVWERLRGALDADNPNKAALISVLKPCVPQEELEAFEGSADVAVGLGHLLLGEESTAKLCHVMASSLLDLTPFEGTDAIGGIGIEGLDSHTLTQMAEVLAGAQRSAGVPVLNSRYHSFLRGPEGLFINLHENRLDSKKSLGVPYVGNPDKIVPVYEIASCRHCGEAFILGTEEPFETTGCPWINPNRKAKDFTDEERDEPHQYYRVLHDAEDLDADEVLYWICPICGSTSCDPEGAQHCFEHEHAQRIPLGKGVSNEEESKCTHCGYKRKGAIQPMRVSPEAVGSLVCYDLTRHVPPFEDAQGGDSLFEAFMQADEAPKAGSVICFSDKRQDAAYFAPAMERTYTDVTVRQILFEAVKDTSDSRGGAGVTPSLVRSWIEEVGVRKYGLMFGGEDKRSVAESWVLGELMTDTYRNSLEGLGVVRVEPTVFLRELETAGSKVAPKAMERDGLPASWLSPGDYLLLVRFCFESLRRQGVLEVPYGVDALLKKRTRVLPSSVVPSGEGLPDRLVSFVGNTKGAENARSNFIRRYVRQARGIELSREDSSRILQSIWRFLDDFCKYLKQRGFAVRNGESDKYRILMDAWSLYPCSDADPVYVCDTCGCEYHWDTHGVCPTYRCDGHLHETTFADNMSKDAHYKRVYRDAALPLDIEEHTAQLSAKQARDVQSEFLRGKVNVLSCTTTFELGVDVGDLRAVFMRNVPPKTANYTQRAGRVGRRAGKPGFAVTFARLRSHDLSLYRDPVRIIRGSNPAPCCYLSNEAIALRHAFAVTLSEYFREMDPTGAELSKTYDKFLNLGSDKPDGLERLRDYLAGHPRELAEQLEEVFPASSPIHEALGIDDWSWTDRLVGQTEGRLVHTHELKAGDYDRVLQARNRYIGEGNLGMASSMDDVLQNLRRDQTITVLAETGVLPKYGFPTDLVELHIPDEEKSAQDNRLRLQRGLRQAIVEYAPGNEVIAAKTTLISTGIRHPKGGKLMVRAYGKCKKCGTFVWPIDDYEETCECKICNETVSLKNKMLIPSEGFIAVKSNSDPGTQRPRSVGFAQIEFCRNWQGEYTDEHLDFAGGSIDTRYAGNGQLCAMNTGVRKGGFAYCPYCDAAARQGQDVKHESWCVDKKTKHYDALGAAFVSDVLEFKFAFSSHVEYGDAENAEQFAWESLCWALYAAAVNVLELPEMEVGATFYRNDAGAWSVLLYDNVPGGAGHVLQLASHAREVVERAYRIVAECTCGEETCCYGCLSNYYNQGRQPHLSRGAALKILKALLLDEACEATYAQTGWQDLLDEAFISDNALSDQTVALMQYLAEHAAPVPAAEIGFELEDCSQAELVWPAQKVCYLSTECLDSRESFEHEGWKVVQEGDSFEDVLTALTA